jgi:acyl-CoA synthetase (AMP-forming)/AMP-acid ligase II
MNTAEFLQISSYAVPDRTALVSGEMRLSYAELAERVSRLASALHGLGIQHGSKVAAVGVNSHRYVELYYACATLGATFVPLNFRAKQEELTHMINTSEAMALALDERYLPLLAAVRRDCRGHE